MTTNDNLEKKLENLAKAIRPSNTIVRDVMNKIESKPIGQTHAVRSINIWRIIMKTRIIRFATAAVVIIAVITAIHHNGGSIDGAGVAWGKVAEKIEQMPAHMVRAKVVATYQDSNMPFLK